MGEIENGTPPLYRSPSYQRLYSTVRTHPFKKCEFEKSNTLYIDIVLLFNYIQPNVQMKRGDLDER